MMNTGGNNDYKESLDNIMAIRKEMAEERTTLRAKEMEETKGWREDVSGRGEEGVNRGEDRQS